MPIQTHYHRAVVADQEAARTVLQDAAYTAAYNTPQNLLQTLRAGTDALIQHPVVRRWSGEIQVSNEVWGGVPCERITTPGADPHRVVLYIHGGAFVRGSLALGRGNAAALAQSSGAVVVAVGYRQAPEHSYPAAPTDVRQVYAALLAVGTDPLATTVVGESSGGCLALGLVSALSEHKLPLPAGVVALSPMTDLAMPGASWDYNRDKDVATREMGQKAIDLYIDPHRLSEPLASPIHARFEGSCPLFLGIGTHEAMLSDTERLAEKAGAAGVAVDLHLYEGMPHGFTRLDCPLGEQVIADAGRWCTQVVASAAVA